jgi:fatty-acyl-CoA synthase
MLNHASVLRRAASSYGGRIAVSFEGRHLTYTDLDDVTDQLAAGLLARGLRIGDRVMWSQANHVDYLLLYYATAKAGLAFSPLNPRMPASELAPLVELVDPALIVAGEAAAEGFAFVDRRVVVHGSAEWRDLFADSAQKLPIIDENQLHEIVFTSGTTGQAKGVMRSQRKRIIDSLCAALGYEITRDDSMLFFAPQFHIGGGAAAGQVLVQGGRINILRGFEPELVAAAIAEGATYMLGVPAHYSLLFESGALDGVDVRTMRGCFVGGSVASRQLFSSIDEVFAGADIVHGYGSTESGPHTTAVRGRAFLDHFGTLGLPIPGTEVKVVDAEGEDAGVGQPGELWVRAESVMDGYVGRPDLTEATFAADDWLRTGDIVHRDDDGYLFLVDRLKEMIITGGENVYPAEVEAVLASYPGVAEAAVIGIPDPVYEERVHALVRLASGCTVTVGELGAYMRERLVAYKVPRSIEFVDDLPRTPLGKVAKSELRRRYGSVFDGDAAR